MKMFKYLIILIVATNLFAANSLIKNSDVAGPADVTAISRMVNASKIYSTGLTESIETAIGNKDIIGQATTATLTNKTIDCSSNTCSNLPVNSATGVLSLANGGTNKNITASNGAIVYSNATQMSLSAVGSSGQVLQSAGAGTPTWSTPTYPSASGTSGKILRSDGTNNVYSSSTFPDTASTSDLLYASGANAWSTLAKTNTSALVSSSSGVPSWASGGTANRLLRTDGTTVSFAQAALATDVSGTLPFGNGGTGQTAYTDGQLLIGNTATGGLSKSTITAGANITVTNGNGTITIASTGGGSSTLTIATKTANYTLTNSDDVILADASSGSFTITLQSSASATTKVYRIKKIDKSLNSVTINRAGSDTFEEDGDTSMVLTEPSVSAVIIPDGGTKWYAF